MLKVFYVSAGGKVCKHNAHAPCMLFTDFIFFFYSVVSSMKFDKSETELVNLKYFILKNKIIHASSSNNSLYRKLLPPGVWSFIINNPRFLLSSSSTIVFRLILWKPMELAERLLSHRRQTPPPGNFCSSFFNTFKNCTEVELVFDNYLRPFSSQVTLSCS